jgi:hypothetical protein
MLETFAQHCACLGALALLLQQLFFTTLFIIGLYLMNKKGNSCLFNRRERKGYAKKHRG